MADATLRQLMHADGLDSPFSRLEPWAWSAFVRDTAARLGLAPGMSVFEIGCGAGAFLHDLNRMGCRVSGIDQSSVLVDVARAALPDGDFEVADATEVDVSQPADVVASCGVFLYFPSLPYAHQVIRAMAEKAQHAVAILDVPDAAKAKAAEQFRIEAAGGPEAYAARYAGLDHLYYDRNWVRCELLDAGLVDVEIYDQCIEGYGNAPFRFNAIAFRPGSRAKP